MENDLISWAFGIGGSAITLGAIARYLAGIWTRDQINRADLRGNLTVLGNQGQFIDDLVKNINDLRQDNATLRAERDDWQRKYYEILVERNNG